MGAAYMSRTLKTLVLVNRGHCMRDVLTLDGWPELPQKNEIHSSPKVGQIIESGRQVTPRR